jgi:hypothetical protein
MYHLMQKLDAMTPWHSLRTYDSVTAATVAAYRFAAERKPGEKYPQYSVNGRQF